MRLTTAAAVSVFLLAVAVAATPRPASEPSRGDRVTAGHGLSMHGDLKHGPGFRHFGYVNPEAPKGGNVSWPPSAPSTPQPLHPQGVCRRSASGEIFDTLTVGSLDEPSSQYGLVAESIEVPADRSWVAYTLRPEARFHDGSPMTAEDVI